MSTSGARTPGGSPGEVRAPARAFREPLLELAGLEAGYGAVQVLFGISLVVGAGECVSLLGRNGMGKTTTVHAVLGIVPPRAGTVRFGGERVDGLPSHRIARAGIGFVPEGRQIFPNLTVRENLVATAANRLGLPRPWTEERIYALFPSLEERRSSMGSLLSGGEQQMLAIGRALMTNPRLLVLDEATEGLAPLVRREIWAVLARLREEGQSILVIDKNLEDLIRVADRHYVMEKGRIVWSGSTGALLADRNRIARHIGV